MVAARSTEKRGGTAQGRAETAENDDDGPTASTTTPKTTNDDNDDLFCPICFRSATCNLEDQHQYDSPKREKEKYRHKNNRTPPREHDVRLVSSSACPHAFCLECVERLFLVSNQEQQAPGSNQDENHQRLLLHIHCPICRTLWSYFDLVFLDNPVQVPITAPSSIFPLQAQLHDCEFCSVPRRHQHSQLQQKSPGYLWFPPAVRPSNNDGSATIATTTFAQHPRWYYYSVSPSHPPTNETSTISSTTAQESLEFIELTQHWYHDTFQTWQGVSDETVAMINGSLQTTCWKVIVSFSADWKFVRRGVVLQTTTAVATTTSTSHSDPNRPMETVHSTAVKQQQQQHQQIQVLCRMGGRHREFPYVRVVPRAIPIQAPVHHLNTLWGNVFCQAFKVGLASYHFVPPSHEWVNDESAAETEMQNQHQHPVAYISYQHCDTAQWPCLDNGAPIPAQVYFSNISFLADHHTFRGTLSWWRDYGTTWQGAAEWEYEMKFASDYSCIVGGTVYSVCTEDTPSPHRSQRQLMSRYGEGLLYCNAGLWNELRRHYDDDNNNKKRGDIRHVIGQVEQQLIRQGATTSVVRMISSLHHAVRQGYPSPMEYV